LEIEQQMSTALKARAGTWVEVRSREEILATLDDEGCLEHLPFMPEMLRYCGMRMRVYKSAHKTCDSTFYGDGRLMRDTVFLEDLRCDGSGHADCQARCQIFFKIAWLKRPGEATVQQGAPTKRDEAWLARTTMHADPDGTQIYACQATQHLAATTPYKWYQFGPFLEDVRSGNWSLRDVARGVGLQLVWRLRFLSRGYRAALWLYARVHRWVYGGPDPHIRGRIPLGSPTPAVALGLRPGEWVRVKTLDEIADTINVNSRNRGLAFNPEMAPYCGGTYKVEQRVTRIVDEKSGKLLDLKGPCIMLEGAHCMARYHPEAVLCPRRIPQYFREAWLSRTVPDDHSPTVDR
jgi:hypothetical protein